MSILVDTGVLLRMFIPADPACAEVRNAMHMARLQGLMPTTAFQNVAEFWNVSTRPHTVRGGYGFSPHIMDARVAFIERRFRILTESLTSFATWRKLVAKHQLQGVAVHDARLVAVMLEHGVSRILTLNPADFARYQAEGISAVTPRDLAP